jgi:hypothetical protein
MSQRKSQRGKKLEDVIEDFKKEIWEFRNKSEKLTEEVKTLNTKVFNMENKWKIDQENLKRCKEGWEKEYNTRRQVEEELDKSEMEKKRMEMKLEVLVKRWSDYEEKIQQKDMRIFTELRNINELNRRVEDLEYKIVCLGNTEDEEGEEERQKIKVKTKVRVIDLEQTREETDVKGSDQEDGIMRNANNDNTKNNKEGKRKVLLVGDFGNKTAGEFCKEEGFGAWPLPGIDINNLGKMIGKSRKAENELPEELVIYVGREDVKRNDKSEDVARNLKELFKTTKEKYGDEVKISMCKWSNNLGRYLNEKMAHVCVEENINLLKINPRWEMGNSAGEMKGMWDKAIGIAIKKSLTTGQQPKESGWGFRPIVYWKKKV